MSDKKDKKKSVKELKTVKDFFEWREPPYKKGDSVEDVNKEFTGEFGLNWKYTDVLYSFLGIYAIGLWVYNEKDKFRVTDNQIFCKRNAKEKEYEQRVYSESFLSGVRKNPYFATADLNKAVKPLLAVYSSLGNVYPIWPGGNGCKGNAVIGCYDIPERYFNENYDWFCALCRIYKHNIFFKGIITPKLKRYSSLENFLKSVNTPEKYKEYIRHICQNIKNREEELKELYVSKRYTELKMELNDF